MSKNVRIKVGLAKKRFTLLLSANECVRNMSFIKFCCADINCRLKIKWHDKNREDAFFKNMEYLQCLIEKHV